MSKQITTNNGTGFLGLLAIVFITLKVIGEISWSWWWVLSPIWIFWGGLIFIFVIFSIVNALLDIWS